MRCEMSAYDSSGLPFIVTPRAVHRHEEWTMANILIVVDEEQVRVLADLFLQGEGEQDVVGRHYRTSGRVDRE